MVAMIGFGTLIYIIPLNASCTVCVCVYFRVWVCVLVWGCMLSYYGNFRTHSDSMDFGTLLI